MLAHSNVFRRPASKAHMAVFGTAPLQASWTIQSVASATGPWPPSLCASSCVDASCACRPCRSMRLQCKAPSKQLWPSTSICSCIYMSSWEHCHIVSTCLAASRCATHRTTGYEGTAMRPLRASVWVETNASGELVGHTRRSISVGGNRGDSHFRQAARVASQRLLACSMLKNAQRRAGVHEVSALRPCACEHG